MLTPRTRELLRHAHHSGREFSPSTTRVVGTLPGMRPPPLEPKLGSQLPYLLPAIELRRLLAEARARNESFGLRYRRLSVSGAPFAGRVVTLTEEVALKPGGASVRSRTCLAEDGGAADAARPPRSDGAPPEKKKKRKEGKTKARCAANELAMLPSSDWWLAGMLIAFPLPMRADGSGELGCLA